MVKYLQKLWRGWKFQQQQKLTDWYKVGYVREHLMFDSITSLKVALVCSEGELQRCRVHECKCMETRCEQQHEASLNVYGNSCCLDAKLLTLSLALCPYRGTWWTKRWGLSPRPVPHGSWTPRTPSAPSALSTRLPYSELTLPPRPHGSGLTCPSSPPPMCLSLCLGLLPCAGHPLPLLSLTQPVTVSQQLVLLVNHSFHTFSWTQVTLFHLVTFVLAKSHFSLVPSCILLPSSPLSFCQLSDVSLGESALSFPLHQATAALKAFHSVLSPPDDSARWQNQINQERPSTHVLHLDAQVFQRRLWSCSCNSMHQSDFSRLSLCSGMQLF